MNRRTFSLSCLGALAALAVPITKRVMSPDTAHASEAPQADRDPNKPHISFLLYEGMTALDLIGPAEVLTGQGFSVDYVSKDKKPVYAESRSNRRLGLVPTATFSDINTTDILCVPGTSNPYIQIKKNEMVEWVSMVGQKAQWVTSVCTGSFILGAAGLLNGYKATSHWALAQELAYFGANPELERVVHDRNRVTGAGVTSGIDFGLVLLSLLIGDKAAQAKQLILEYDPHPPFNSGSPKTANQELIKTVQKQYQNYLKQVAPDSANLLREKAIQLGIKTQQG
ncbi:DJ-1/PfpI family protein [Maridesulfovibrio sp.]|uniref:DJ-1/PfpI family protein n=1 Tax=Maridesulfovibrio sp. TaxID=2795000 RepID=UPI002A189FF3|nr:DJ-1/PfpI family protein [Maridesulfovibrio sp.]